MNPASALHRVLAQVQVQETPLTACWGKVLHAEYGSPDFVRRHAEVMGLLAAALRMAAGLPESARDRNFRYAQQWWSALVMPQHNWPNTGGSASLSPSDLDHLGALGDLLEDRLPHTAANPDDSRLEQLRQTVATLLLDLDEFTSLATPTRRLIRADLMHVLWLIDNVETFGTGRVAEEAQRVTGAVTVASQGVADPEQRQLWVAKASNLFAATSMFVVAVTGSTTVAITGVNEVLDQVQIAQEHVVEIVDGAEANDEDPTGKAEPSP